MIWPFPKNPLSWRFHFYIIVHDKTKLRTTIFKNGAVVDFADYTILGTYPNQDHTGAGAEGYCWKPWYHFDDTTYPRPILLRNSSPVHKTWLYFQRQQNNFIFWLNPMFDDQTT